MKTLIRAYVANVLDASPTIEEIARAVPGLTHYTGTGVWRDEQGRTWTEPCRIFEVAADTDEKDRLIDLILNIVGETTIERAVLVVTIPCSWEVSVVPRREYA